MSRDYWSQVLFVVTFGVVIYGAFFYDDTDLVVNYKRGLQAGAFVIVAAGTLKTYDPPFNRPNYAFWRAVSKAVLVYLVALVFLVFQKPSDARQLMKHLYPELGVPVEKDMHTYDDNCGFEWENIADNLDHYFYIHCINWFLAALIVRDQYILHFWSILDELIELSWQHILPHFRECWWDHVLVDVLFANTPFIIIGVLLTRALGWKKYDWLGRDGKKSIADWDIFQNHRRFGGVCALFIVIIANFLTGFFLINGLWIPPKNYLNLFRLAIWFLASNLAFRELYEDVSTWGTPKRKDNPVGAEYRWLILAITLLEVLVSWKMKEGAGNMLNNPWPAYITVPWLLIIVGSVLFYLHLRFNRDGTQYAVEDKKKKKNQKEKENAKAAIELVNSEKNKSNEGAAQAKNQKKKANEVEIVEQSIIKNQQKKQKGKNKRD